MTEVQRLAKIMVLKDMRKEYELRAKYNGGVDYDCYRALDMAIAALEQEPCTDAISRQAMHIELEKWITYGEYKYSNATQYLYDRIDRLPPVTPTEKVGKWIDIQYFKADDTYYRPKCPFCSIEPKEYSNYCPNCGAKMLASPTGAEKET